MAILTVKQLQPKEDTSLPGKKKFRFEIVTAGQDGNLLTSLKKPEFSAFSTRSHFVHLIVS